MKVSSAELLTGDFVGLIGPLRVPRPRTGGCRSSGSCGT